MIIKSKEMDILDECQIGDNSHGCEHNKLLKKNLSWTHTPGTISTSNINVNVKHENSIFNNHSLAKANSLRISRSNPHVLESLPSNLKFKMPSLQLITSRFHSQMLPQNGLTKIAPLAKAISFTSVATSNQTATLSTPTAIRFKNLQRNKLKFLCKSSGIGEPSVYHALVVIFLEYFSWGLLTMPIINVLNKTFPDHTFLMNGLVMGIKGIFSFLSAPLIGALSDVWGRKFFLLITVFFTCAPIPLMSINSWWFFAMISISGVFAVTFSVVFAYVADVTTVHDRSRAYGLVSATFAASLVISPALGAYLNDTYSESLVVALATAIAVLDVFFILVAVPESLPEKVRPKTWNGPINWEQADPFSALRRVGMNQTVLMQCLTVLLSYLPEAGQYSCIFVYLKLKMHFSSLDVSIFIAVVGVLSIVAQMVLGDLMRILGAKRTIIIGLTFEMLQLLWYGIGTQTWMMWGAGILAALASITYPAISAFVSVHTHIDEQGVVQGMVTGMRGLCNGLGPAMFGVIFYLFNVDLNDESKNVNSNINFNDIKFNLTDSYHLNHNEFLTNLRHEHHDNNLLTQFMPGPPFVLGSMMVVVAILVAIFIKEDHVIDAKRTSIVGPTSSNYTINNEERRGYRDDDEEEEEYYEEDEQGNERRRYSVTLFPLVIDDEKEVQL